MSLTLYPLNTAAGHVRKCITASHYGDSKFLGMSFLSTALAPWSWAGPLAASVYVMQYARESYCVRKPLSDILEDVLQHEKRWGVLVRLSELAILVETVIAATTLEPFVLEGKYSIGQSVVGKTMMVLAPTHLLTHLLASDYYVDTVDDRCAKVLNDYNRNWLTRFTFAGVQN